MVKYKSRPLVIPNLLAAHLVKRIYSLQIQVVDLGKIHLGSYYGYPGDDARMRADHSDFKKSLVGR